MKKIFLILSVFFFGSLLQANEMALIYENETAVKEGRPFLSPVTAEGIVVPAKMALNGSGKLLGGKLQDKLRKVSILRLDNQIDVAVLQLGDTVDGVDLQKAFQVKANAVSAFLGTTSVSGSQMVPSGPQITSSEPFVLKINGEVVGSQSIELPVYFQKSDFTLEVIQPSTTTVWNTQVKLTADPKLSFWKKGKTKDLNDVPRPEFKYEYQSMFVSLSNGKSFTVPIDVYFIKQDAYTFNFTVSGKKYGTLEKQVPIIFKHK